MKRENGQLVDAALDRMRISYSGSATLNTAEMTLDRAGEVCGRWSRRRGLRRRLVLGFGVLVIVALLLPLPREGEVRMLGFELGRGLLTVTGHSSQSWQEVWEEKFIPLIEDIFEARIEQKYINRLMAMELPEEFAVQYRNVADVMAEETKIAGSAKSWSGTFLTEEEVEADRQFSLSWRQYGWKPIRGILTEVEGLPLDSPVKPIDELTPAERALLWPYFPYQNYLGGQTGDNYIWGPIEATIWVLQRRKLREVSALECLKNEGGLGGDAILAESAFTRAEYERWFARNHLTRYASPVSRRVFEPDHPTYSRGNGYVRRITEPEAVAAINQAVEQAGMVLLRSWTYGRFVPAEPGHIWDLSDVSWYYFRLYGEKEGSVIAEGLLPRWRNSWPPAPLTYQGKDPKYRTRWKERRERLKARMANYEEWLAARSDQEVAEILLREEALAFYPVTAKYSVSGAHFSDTEVERLRRGDLPMGALDTVEGLPLRDPLQPLSELAAYDKATIVGLLSGEDSALSWFMGLGIERIDSMEQWLRVAFTPEQLREMLLKWGTLKTPEFRRYLRLEVPPPYAAPVSSELMLPIFRDFEPWEGYFAKITDEKELARVAKAAGYTPEAVYYFRLYGEDRILAEGLRLIP